MRQLRHFEPESIKAPGSGVVTPCGLFPALGEAFSMGLLPPPWRAVEGDGQQQACPNCPRTAMDMQENRAARRREERP